MREALRELLHVLRHDGDAAALCRDLGFADGEDAQEAFVELWNHLGEPGRAAAVFAAVLACAEPVAAARALVELATAAGDLDDAVVLPIIHLAASSPQSIRTLVLHPEALGPLRDALAAPTPKEAFAERLRVARAAAPDAPERVFRRFRAASHARIAARDIGGAPMAEVLAELADVAEASVDAAVELALERTAASHGRPLRTDGAACGFVALGMGKLGGRELNFSSDIDLIYVYETDDGEARRDDGVTETLHEHFSRVARLATKLLSEPTEDGFAYRVDLALRPEGKKGPLVNSLASMEAYYETWGQTWERAAMLKARPVGGDRDFGERVLAALSPFVFRRSLDQSVFDEIRDMKRRVDDDERRRGGAWNVKLGRGGIREIEFLVQAHQLLLAGKRPALRARGTLDALSALRDGGVLRETEVEALRDAYLFFRRLEHRLQMEEGRQTHRMPETLEGRGLLARRLGFGSGCPRTPDGIASEGLEREILRHRRDVMGAFDGLLAGSGAPKADSERDAASIVARAIVESGGEAHLDDELRAAMRQLGLREPDVAFAHVARLGRTLGTPLHRASPHRVRTLGPALFRSIRASPDPDLALRHLAAFALRLRGRFGSYALLQENPATLRTLSMLFGTSDFLARLVSQRPELLDPLLIGVAATRGSAELLARELRERCAGLDDEARLDAWRAYHVESLLRIGLGDVAGTLDLRGVQGELTQLAEAILREVSSWAVDVVLRRGGGSGEVDLSEPALSPTGHCIVGMGKLGGGELNYNSDLDLLFLFDGDGQATVAGTSRTAQDHFSRVAQKLLFGLSCNTSAGVLYHIDARLRPSGRQGSLVSSLDALARYHGTTAQFWERLALVRARPVVGPADLVARAKSVLEEAAYGRPLPEGGAREVARLRERMERENAKEDAERANVKLGRGGLVDVEFTTQLLQLKVGFDEPRVRVPGTLDALAALGRVGAWDASALRALDEGYVFLRRLENRLRIVHDNAQSVLVRAAAAAVARGMGLSSADELLARYAEITERNRAIFSAVVEALS